MSRWIRGSLNTSSNVDTGANIALATTYAGMLAYCTATGSGFTAGILYRRNAANTAWEQVIDDSSAQTIAGVKTFSAAPNFTGNVGVNTTTPNGVGSASGLSGQNVRIYGTGATDHCRAILEGKSAALHLADIVDGTPGQRQFRLQADGNVLTLGAANEDYSVVTDVISVTHGGGTPVIDILSNLLQNAALVNPLFHSHGRLEYDWTDLDQLSATATYVTAVSGGIKIITDGTNPSTSYFSSGKPFRRDRKFEIFFMMYADSNLPNQFEIGLSTATTPTALQASSAHYCSIKYDAGTSANFIASNANGTSATSTTSAVAAAVGTWYTFMIISNETSIKFYVNGTLIATHTTNLPNATTEIFPFCFRKTTTTNNDLFMRKGKGWSDVA